MKDWFANGLMFLGGIGAILFFVQMCGCSAARVGCDIIDVADHACETFVVRYKDQDGVVRTEVIHRRQLEVMAEKARLERVQRDSGAE